MLGTVAYTCNYRHVLCRRWRLGGLWLEAIMDKKGETVLTNKKIGWWHVPVTPSTWEA
jgi:hypothetical protein